MNPDKSVIVGLNAQQVAESRARHGSNVLTPPPREPWWKEYLSKFEDPVIRILMIAAVIAIVVGLTEGRIAEGVGIIIAILLATGIAYWNEHRAAKEFDVLNQSNDEIPIKVLRASGYTTVARRELVVGDIVRIEVGEEVPADGTLIEATSLQVSEAKLTGESRPVDKGMQSDAGAGTYPVNRLLRGTTIVDGHGLYTITSVGDSTEIGRTARESVEVTGEATPLNRQLEQLSKVIGVVGLGMAALTFIVLVLRSVVFGEIDLSASQWWITICIFAGLVIALSRVWLPVVFDGLELIGSQIQPPKSLESEGFLPWLKALAAGVIVTILGVAVLALMGSLPSDSWLPSSAGRAFLSFFMIAVTIIVVAVPEGLAMSVTLSLAYSMRKMTASNNLVRKMHACETIGAATVICSDKTGTLTENSMRVADVSFGGFSGPSLPTDSHLRNLVVEAVAANTTAHLSRLPGEPVTPLGNPTEGALLIWLEKQGMDYIEARTAFKVARQMTFSTERKSMDTIGYSTILQKQIIHTKGAPEIVLSNCQQEYLGQTPFPMTNERREVIEKELLANQSRGMRTLGFAVASYEDANNKAWLGYVAIEDPVRAEVPEAIAACRRAGVAVKIVTGDNLETAREVAKQIGLDLNQPGSTVSGPTFSEQGDEIAGDTAMGLSILARARPKDKMRLVTLLKERGHVVAVTGDGVNDGPALNHADVGLSMGKTGSAVAKEASDIILLDDSFKSIVNAILWGRSLYENIQRFILYQLTINVAALVIALIGPFMGVALPLTVMQMLWINLIMDTFAALALATEPPHTGVMDRGPRSVNAFIVTGAMAKNIFLTGFVFVAILITALIYYQNSGELLSESPSRGGTIFFTLFVLLQFWNLFNARCLGKHHSAFRGLLSNPSFLAIAAAILVGQILIVQFGGEAFRTIPLTISDWLCLIAATSLVLWIGEGIRLLRK